MKKQLLSVLMLVPFLASAQINSFPYTEDFESGAGGWEAVSVLVFEPNSWILGTPDQSVIDQAAPGGTISWYTDTTGYQSSEYSHVLSPVFDFSGLDHPTVSIDVWWDLHTNVDGAVFQSSIDGGSSWQNVGHHDDNTLIGTNWYNHAFLSEGFPNGGAGLQQVSHWSGDSLQGSQGWITATHFLEGLAGESNVQFRLAWANRNGNADRPSNGFAFDNVQVFEGAAVDLRVDDVIQAGPCGGGIPGFAQVQVSNLGADEVTITHLEDDQGTQYPIASTVIPAFSTVTILVELPLQNPGSTSMILGAVHPQDFNSTNDFFIANFDCNVVDGLNHCNSFEELESAAPWFNDPTGVNSSWNLGGNANNQTINQPLPILGGASFWATTGPSGTYNSDEQSSIVSPYFDFSNLENTGVSFALWWDIEPDFDGAVFQSSVDGGTSWQNVGIQGSGSNWFNYGAVIGGGSGGQNTANWNGASSGNFWVEATHSTPSLDGEPYVLFRLALGADDIGQDGGLGFDNFCITGTETSEDVAITNVEQLEPCGGGFSSAVFVTIENLGSSAQTISQITDNQGGVHPISPITIAPQESFDVLVDLPLTDPGTINLTLTVTIANDVNLTNNNYPFEFDCNVVDAENHVNDFEDDDFAVWRPQIGNPSSWNLGANSDNVTINTPSNTMPGAEFWCTNAGGQYYQDENSSVVSPFFDFSNMMLPIIEFDKWVDLETNKDGVVMEYSLDGGNAWETAGETAYGVNSYNAGSLPNGGAGNQNVQHWSGDGAEGTQGWETTILPMPDLAGLSNVLLRFALRSDTTVVDEGGFGFDNMGIREADAPTVVINEFNYTDSRGEAYDFVELKNIGNNPVDMANFRLNFIKKTGGVASQYDTILAPPLTGIVPPDGYYVIGDTGSAFLFSVNAFALTPSQGVLGDTGAIELVYTPLGLRMDVVAYGDDISGFTEGNAIEFADPGSLFYRGTGFSRLPDGDDIQNNLTDFRFRCYTPGFTNEPTDSVCYTPKLVINEFNYTDPSGEDFDFIELRNNDTEAIDLADFELNLYDDAAALTMPTLALGGTLSSDDYYVIGAPNGVQNQDFTLLSAPDYVEGPDGSIEVIYKPNNSLADIVGYGDNFPTFDENGPIEDIDEARFIDYTKSFARAIDGFDTDDNDPDFTFECHTPGEENGSSEECLSLMVINEVDKLGANGDSVFVELYNKTPILGDLNGFILEFDDATNLDSIVLDGTIGNQGYRVLGIPSSGFDSDHVTIMLQDTQSTTIVDRLTIAQTPVGLPNTEGEFTTLDASATLSISRIPNGQDLNDNNSDFELVCATLGSENFNDLSCDVVGMEEANAASSGLLIYPNPAIDYIQIELNSNQNGLVSITLFDAVGRQVFHQQMASNARIELTGLARGIYTLVASDANGKYFTQKFIKE